MSDDPTMRMLEDAGPEGPGGPGELFPPGQLHPEVENTRELQELRLEVPQLRNGLRKALDILRTPDCENCGGSLAETPPRGACGDQHHVMVAQEIATLSKLL